MDYSKLNKDFKVYSIAIIIGLLTPMLFSTIFVFSGIINNKMIDFSDHGIRLLVALFSILSYASFFLIMEIYIIYRYIKSKKASDRNLLTKNILLIILIVSVFSIIEAFLLFCAISENWILLFSFTLILLLPYIYICVKRMKLKKE